MPAGTFTITNSGKLAIFNGTISLTSDTFTMALLLDTYTPSATHSTWADLSASECQDADYTQKALTNVTVSGASGSITFDSDDVSFGTTVSITAKYAVIIKGTAGALLSTDSFVGYVDLNSGGGSATSTNSVFSVGTPSGFFTAT